MVVGCCNLHSEEGLWASHHNSIREGCQGHTGCWNGLREIKNEKANNTTKEAGEVIDIALVAFLEAPHKDFAGAKLAREVGCIYLPSQTTLRRGPELT